MRHFAIAAAWTLATLWFLAVNGAAAWFFVWRLPETGPLAWLGSPFLVAVCSLLAAAPGGVLWWRFGWPGGAPGGPKRGAE